MSPPSPRTRLVVIFGGMSAEHDISCVSAAHVMAAVDPSRYELVPIGITRTGQWVQDQRLCQLARDEPTSLPGTLTARGEAVVPQQVLDSLESQQVVVFPLVHGPHGEDGTLQGLLELAGVPYIGTGVLGSSICMDKTMAKTLTAAVGIPQARAFHLTQANGDPQALANKAETLMALGEIDFPVFVKPASMGSSVGISKAHGHTELEAAIDLALSYDERLVIEEAIAGREIEVAVLGNTISATSPRASIPGEIVPAAEFYDYDDKYADGAATLLIPAELNDNEIIAVQELAIEAYQALRCDGMARVDFFYEPNDRGFLLNEINTIPGFTPLSMYPKLWEASGLPYSELIDELVQLAIERHVRRSAFSTST